MQRLTVDIETKVLNDLDERVQTLTKMTVDRPEFKKKGKIIEYWKSDLELEKWFDPAFEEFINRELIPTVKNK